MQPIEIYTDGACKGNPGPGGWGVWLRYGDKEKELFVSSFWMGDIQYYKC